MIALLELFLILGAVVFVLIDAKRGFPRLKKFYEKFQEAFGMQDPTQKIEKLIQTRVNVVEALKETAGSLRINQKESLDLSQNYSKKAKKFNNIAKRALKKAKNTENQKEKEELENTAKKAIAFALKQEELARKYEDQAKIFEEKFKELQERIKLEEEKLAEIHSRKELLIARLNYAGKLKEVYQSLRKLGETFDGRETDMIEKLNKQIERGVKLAEFLVEGKDPMTGKNVQEEAIDIEVEFEKEEISEEVEKRIEKIKQELGA